MNTISWSQIESECGDYRAGFVATFRKYEGQATDEKDEQGRTVKVTAASFARHVGVPAKTFQGWIRKAESRPVPSNAQGAIRGFMSRARALPSEEKAELARELLADPDVTEHVVADPENRRTLAKATDRHYQKQATERAERTERKVRQDPVAQRIQSAEWINKLGEAAERFHRDGEEALRHVGDLPESERFWLSGAIRRARQTVDAAERYMELGRPEIDVELEHLANGGA